MKTDYDVIVVGAGPAGCSFVMALENSGLKIALVDKSTFPRDKVCGDAIPGRAGKVLESISAEHATALQKFEKKTTIWRARAVGPDFNSFDISFARNGYAATRFEFDHFLLELARRNLDCDFLLGEKVEKVSQAKSGVEAKLSTGGELKAKLIIGCDGTHSVVNKQMAGTAVDKNHHCGAVRAYYENVEGLESDLLEFYLLKDFLPGYFWIFPLHDGSCNVGFGMLTKEIARRNVKLMEVIPTIIANTPSIKNRFKNAKLKGSIKGFGLPLGSRKVKLAGTRFMLCGDAASLIEPATGEGIGCAMLSGTLAAQQTLSCFEHDDFSEKFMLKYEENVYAELWKELRTKYWIQKLFGNRPGLLAFFIRQAKLNPVVRKLIKLL